MSGFTPGPWVLERGDEEVWIGVPKPTGHGLHDVVVVVDCDSGQTRSFQERALANAQLIAAAPDLLRVVTDLLDVWDPQWEPGRSLHARALAAVALARGRTP